MLPVQGHPLGQAALGPLPFGQLGEAAELVVRLIQHDDDDREGRGGHAQAAGDLRVGDRVPDAQPGQPGRLGEGPQHHQVGVLPVQGHPLGQAALGPLPLGQLGEAAELVVRLIQHDDDVLRDLLQERLHGVAGQGRAGRVVGGAQQHHGGALGDRRGHGLEVVAPVLGQRHLHRAGPGQAHHDRVGLEGAPRVDDLVLDPVRVLPGEGREDLGQRPEAARPGDDVLRGNLQVPRQGLAQPGGQRIRVQVGVPEGVDDLRDGRHRSQRVLVGGQLELSEPLHDLRRLPGGVGRQLVEHAWTPL
ncbi:Uncharacterised protein [Mycobacteroides abscessus subsp. abscessus]|nr:Uncharacterised protein [Mycobacteroides abscessus subsp. abscessus]